ncbi:Alcohol dehydrogenase GroES-like domain-containing protein [Cladophialophora immunda]|nr:Alcohol dehydrogenase GroES-like domain-containing protein [Cladophialophora immunda]
MRALQFHARCDLRVDDVPEPHCGPNMVKIKNEWAGICGSDLHEYLVGPFTVPSKPHCLTGKTAPCILGHEFAGTIVEVGSDAKRWKVGQRVVVEPIIYDGTCGACKRGVPKLCEKLGWVGYSGTGGGFAEYVCVAQQTVHSLPENIPLDVGALVEPLAVAWHAVKISKIEPGQTAMIMGAGPIGLAILLSLQAFGVQSILVSELSPQRIARAQEFGASAIFDPSKTDLSGALREFGEAEGPHVVFECAGVAKSFEGALISVRPGGVVVNVGMFERPVTFDPNMILRKEITYQGALIYSSEEFEEVIEAISSGKLPL